MKKVIFVLFVLLGMNINAQPLSKYPVLPSMAWDFIIDYAETLHYNVIDGRMGVYIGQVDGKHMLTGLGCYIDSKDNQRIGLFRDGKFEYGITLTQSSAMVGTLDHYAVYSLTTADMEYIVDGLGRYTPGAEHAADRFVSIVYENGDRYIGETVNGKREGMGLYYYANGDFWYGQYHNGVRDGYGCLFCHDNMMWVGRWAGEDTRRLAMIKK